MAHGTDRRNNHRKNGDYSCEVLSLIVLFLLSALSHFWYVLLAFGVGIFLWLGVIALGRFLIFATRIFPRHEKYPVTMVPGPKRHAPEWHPEVSASHAKDLPAAAACDGTANLCKESASGNQVF